ncbi:hypothetical protein R1T43_06280 [Alteromonas sp. CI.11.F.A3]|uniref:hypothetical protein n=1 Tax=Alteromonas sp. CI.11.F.A3 TaxID=3079555 RepID=UPI002943AB86|nr:hypothetical protein [Alteromonas sp. CI.11.F.A3]WOI38637.1 hypothetical protein R1T43_06280 [Alteromonas sp. CI.11.F.A3]
MNKWFWRVLILCFLMVNAETVDWLLAITIGGYSFDASDEHTFRYFSLSSYFDSAIFQLIPYLLLAGLAAFQGRHYCVHEKIAFWAALIAITLFHCWGYWGVNYSSYTDGHLSSTASLALIFIPLHAIWVGLLTGITVGLLSLLCACVIKKICGA